MAELRLGENIVIPAIVVRKSVVPNYIAPKNNVNGIYKPDNTATSFSLNGATDVDWFGLAYAFYGCTNLESLDLTSLTTVSNPYAMYYSFRGCTKLKSVDLPSLTTLSNSYGMMSAFALCRNLTSINFPSLTTVSGGSAMASCFQACGITTVNFPSLATISGFNAMYSCFADCPITDIYFSALQSFGTSTNMNQLSEIIGRVKGCTLHFPSNMQSEVERREGYPNFGGTNTVVLFDLPPTA